MGVPTSLSPWKKNKNNSDYFQAKLIDSKKQTTLWGNIEKQREQLKTSESTKSAIKISDCEVRNSKQSGQLEMVLKPTSTFEKSPTKFPVKEGSEVILDQ